MKCYPGSPFVRSKFPLTAVAIFALPLCAAMSAAVTGARHPVRPSKGAPGGPLKAQIDMLLAAPEVARAHWGISVATLDGQPLYQLNDAQYFTPASNAKLFTTAAAAALLLSQPQPATTLTSTGSITADGTLHGDLILTGSGDPTLSGRAYPYAGKTERPNPPLGALQSLADQLKARGIHSVEGDIIGDDTAFPFERYGSGWSWDDLQWDYGAPASALTVNDNNLFLNVSPGAKPGDLATTALNPDVAYYSLANTTTTSVARSQTALRVERLPGSKVLRIFGTVPAESKGSRIALTIEDPAEYAAIALRQMLIADGIAVAGTAKPRHRPSIDTQEYLVSQARPLDLSPAIFAGLVAPLATYTGPPLLEDLVVTNKVSQNLHAELLLRRLGKTYGADGSILEGARVVRQFLVNAGIDPGDFVFYDGSGMSVQDEITPRSVTQLLRYAAAQSWGGAFRSTLPIGGVDGSLSGRFNQPGLKGMVFAKTGTLSETNALSGYLTAASGKTVVFSILCNEHHPGSEAARQVIDRIVAAIAASN